LESNLFSIASNPDSRNDWHITYWVRHLKNNLFNFGPPTDDVPRVIALPKPGSGVTVLIQPEHVFALVWSMK
jgi:hypothetical protein